MARKFFNWLGKHVANFINSGGWITCIILGVVGIVLAFCGHILTMKESYLSEEYNTFTFMVITEVFLIAFVIWSFVKIIKLIKNNKEIFKL